MLRKSVWGAIFLNSALALALAIYTVVALATGLGKKTSVTEVFLALREGDEFVVESGKTSFEGQDGELETIDGKQIATTNGDGKFKCTVTNGKNKTVYNVTVYGYGDGSTDNPYNITKASDLLNLSKDADVTIYDELGATYALRADIDLAGINWAPIGTSVAKGLMNQFVYDEEGQIYSYRVGDEVVPSAFTGNFIGNGYKIKNLTIDVTTENFKDFVTVEYAIANGGTLVVANNLWLDVGFFGYAEQAMISGVEFVDAKVSIAAEILNGDYICTDCIDEAARAKDVDYIAHTIVSEKEPNGTNGYIYMGTNAGVVVAAAVNCSIGSEEKAVSIVNASLVAGNGDANTGIGLVAGDVKYTAIQNITIENSSVTANAVQTVAGGVVGNVRHRYSFENSQGAFEDDELAYQSIVKNVKIDGLKITGDADSASSTAAIAGIAYGAKIENVEAANVEIALNVNNEERNNTNSTFVAGGVAQAYSVLTASKDYTFEMTNVSINAKINAVANNIRHHVAGVTTFTDGTLTNVSFSGEIVGGKVAGLVLYNEGTIAYTEEFAGKAVDATLYAAHVAGGMVAYNTNGVIIGAENGTDMNVTLVVDQADKYTSITALKNVSGVTGTNDQVVDSFAVGGVAAHMIGGRIENINVKVSAKNAINVGGAVAFLGGSGNVVKRGLTYNDTYVFTLGGALAVEGGILNNVNVDADIVTVVGTHMGTTKRAAGVVAYATTGAKMNNIVAVVAINNYELAADVKASGFLTAGLVAEMNGAAIELNNAEVSAFIRVSNTSYKTGDDYVAIAAGAVAMAVQTEGDAISMTNIKVVAKEGGYDSIINMLGSKDNNGANVTFATDVAGAFGIFGQLKGLNGTSIAVNNVAIENYNVVAYYNTAKVVGVLENANVLSYSITNTDEQSPTANAEHGVCMSKLDNDVITVAVVEEETEQEENVEE